MDLTSFSGVLAILQAQGYLIMFLLMFYEGPMITSVAAFAASLGYFNIYIVFGLSVLGNITGDIVYYIIGRVGRKIVVDRYFKKYGISNKVLSKLEIHLKNHPWKLLTLIKVIPPLPTPGLILAGAIKMSFAKFLFYTASISFIFSLIFAVLGYYLGAAFYSVFSYTKYLPYGVIGLIIIVGLILWIYSKYAGRLFKYISKVN